MPLNPIAQKILDAYSSLNLPPVPTLSPQAARNAPSLKYAIEQIQADHLSVRAMNVAKPAQESVYNISHLLIPTPAGDLLARVYKPLNEKALLPVIVYFHGGGWVFATLDTYDSSCRSLANETGMIVVSVAYRQAPENKFPAAVDDAFAAYTWLRDNADSYGGDAGWVAVAGESAGGNLATVTCLKARAADVTPPDFQLLIYPVTDLSSQTESYREHFDAKPLSSDMMPWFRNHYLRTEADAKNPYASPLLAPDLSGLPPAHIITVEFDPLRDEGELYAQRLSSAGVHTTMKRYEGLMHEAFGLAAAIPEAKLAVKEAGAAVREAYRHAFVGA